MARKPHGLPVPAWAMACVLVLLSGGLAVWVWQPPAPDVTVVEEVRQAGPENPEAFADSVAFQARKVLVGLGIPEGAIGVEPLPENRGSAMRWEVRSEVPGDLPLEVCNLALTRLVRRMGGEVVEGRQDLSGNQLSLLLGLRDERTNLVTLRRNSNLVRTVGRIAIIIDDIGYQDRELIQKFCALTQRVTLSIFPGETRSVWAAKRAVAEGHEVMIHLPMEPIDYPERDPGPSAIFVDDPEEKIRTLTRKALVSIPYARGVNNHMGSRVTENREAIGSVLKEIQRAKFFFVDSVTSPQSVAYDVAQEMGVTSGRNALFLDREEETTAVEQALYRLAQQARREGTVIGIGHPKPATLAALQRVLPELEREGIVFIRAEDAVR